MPNVTIDNNSRVSLGLVIALVVGLGGVTFSAISFAMVRTLNSLDGSISKLDQTLQSASQTLADHEKRISINEVEIKALKK